jgi:signal transduction histidine kinase
VTSPPQHDNERLQRELSYYRRECNDLGARLLRLQEEQSQAFREARRSRTTAKLVREAYRLADGVTSPAAIGGSLLEVIVADTMCDRAAFLAESHPASGRFAVTHLVGLSGETEISGPFIPHAPTFFFTTSQTRIEPPAFALMGILQVPYILWAYDPVSGNALIVGNRSESNVSRPFEAGDQELIEGALSVYLDVLTRKQSELRLLRAKKAAEETVDATAVFLQMASGALRPPLNSIIGCAEKMGSGSRYPLTIESCVQFADRINESGVKLVSLFNDLLEYSSFARARPLLTPEWRPLTDIVTSSTAVGVELSNSRHLDLAAHVSDSEIELNVDQSSFRQALDQLLASTLRSTTGRERICFYAFLQHNGSLELGLRNDGAVSEPVGDAGGQSGVSLKAVPGHPMVFDERRLPIVRAMFDGHEGDLTVRTAAGETTVSVVFPPHRVRLRPRSHTMT